MTEAPIPEPEFVMDLADLESVRTHLQFPPDGDRLTQIGTREILVEKDAILELLQAVRKLWLGRILVVMDLVPMDRSGKEVKAMTKDMFKTLRYSLNVSRAPARP